MKPTSRKADGKMSNFNRYFAYFYFSFITG